MTPSRMDQTSPQNGAASVKFPRSGRMKAEIVGDLSFDELRELPMSVQLGMDLSALD